jgi:alkaline phosphatase D
MYRRDLLQSMALFAATYPVRRLSAFAPQPQFRSDPFVAGVASGDPTVDGVVLWTRLVPDVNRREAWQAEAIRVEWQVASDENFKQIVRRGRELALPELGHSVHVDVSGLQPGRWYWYRFHSGSAMSPVGRTRTAPSGSVDKLRFAIASCQSYHQGYYTAYRNMVSEDLDFVVFLGDYIYETGGTGVRSVSAEEPRTLEGYRERYALYRSDPNLREAHRLFPWIFTWDDHEVRNDYANDVAPDNRPREEFLSRRAAAYQANYEWMPLPRASAPKGRSSRMYRTLSFGSLTRILVLDGRQYRSPQPCGGGGGLKPPCADFQNDHRTMLGAQQEQWLDRELRESNARWNILANQVQMTPVDRDPGPAELYSLDTWAGYDQARRRLLSTLRDSKVSNPVVVTGDIHSNWVGDLKIDYEEKDQPIVGTEIIGTSISSGGDGTDSIPNIDAYVADNPQIKFYNNQRGYVRCEVRRESFTADFRVVEKVSVPESPVSTRATFIIEDGRPGATRA